MEIESLIGYKIRRDSTDNDQFIVRIGDLSGQRASREVIGCSPVRQCDPDIYRLVMRYVNVRLSRLVVLPPFLAKIFDSLIMIIIIIIDGPVNSS